ncbi:MAG: CBS domain-containing protein [Candidatus Micrarchaeia archaeon]
MELSKAIIVSADDTISKALGKIQQAGLGAVVFQGKKYVGMIDERRLRERRIDISTTKCSNAVVKTPVLDPQDSLQDICNAFFAGRFKSLPVMEGGNVLGIVGRWEILAMLEKSGFLKGHKVQNHMSSPIMTVNASNSAAVANSIMQEANVRRLVVLENGRLAGIVSVFDLLPTRTDDGQRKPELKQQKRKETDFPVRSFMKTDVETIGQDASISEAVRKMLYTKKAALIVLEGERPAGIITAKDILETVVHVKIGLPVIVSGLDGIDKSLTDDITVLGEKLLSKMKNMGAESLSIHVKGEGSRYVVAAHVRGKKAYRAHATDFELISAVHQAMDEIEVQAKKDKKIGMSGRRN